MEYLLYKDLKVGDMFTVKREKHSQIYVKQDDFVIDPVNHNRYRKYHCSTKVRKVENL